MSDLISRQAALDEMAKRFQEWLALFGYDSYEVANDRIKLVCDGIMKGMEAVMDLPSAQPEIIRCKECKHFEYDHPYIIQGMPVLGHEVCNAWGDGCKTDENGYCFMAERRTDEVKPEDNE